MHNVTYHFFEILLLFGLSYDFIHTHIYRLSKVAFLFIGYYVNSNCIRQIIEKAILFLIRYNIGSIPPFLRVLGIFNSDAWFGTGTSFARTMTIFQNRCPP